MSYPDVDLNPVGIYDSAVGHIHGVGSSVLAVGSHNQHRLRIHIGIRSKIFTHSDSS